MQRFNVVKSANRTAVTLDGKKCSTGETRSTL
jgi:hypothetical protein